MKTFDFNVWMKEKHNIAHQNEFYTLLHSVKCVDGFTISVQASSGHYCQPRETGAYEYHMVECGYPSQVPDFILEYAEDSERPTDTVYGYVPVELVNKLINSHGGVL